MGGSMNFARHRSIPTDRIPSMPFALKAMGYYQTTAPWEEENDGIHRPHCGLFWCADGSAEFMIGTCPFELKKNEVLCYYPFEAHRIRVLHDSFEYFWITFDGTDVSDTLAKFRCFREPFRTGPPPETLFREAYDCLGDLSEAALYRGGAIVYQILSMAACPREKKDTDTPENLLVSRFQQIVDEESGNRELNLMKIASRLHCHRTTLTRLVKQKLGFLPVHYLNQVRLRNALELLENSDLTAAEISEVCGFATPEYFSRKFKQLTGEPPRRFRNH